MIGNKKGAVVHIHINEILLKKIRRLNGRQSRI